MNNNLLITNHDKSEVDFILHQPKSHVSGDFYWVSGNEDQKIIAVGDCTGHGIFGGLMHMLGAVYLNEIIEIKGDRMPVGIHVNFNKPFTNNEIELKSNDQLYMFSDGYADQFGGHKGKKFRYKQFKELILNNCHELMNIQKEILNNVQDKWRGSLEQIDDILVFGIKIK